MKDFEIVKKLQAGEDINKVTEYLYKVNRSSVINMAYKYTRNKEDAEEVFNDSILTFIRKVKTNGFDFSKSATTKTFIYAIAELKCLKKNESNNRRLSRDGKGLEELLSQADILNAEEIMILDENYNFLWGAFDKLCEPCRKILKAYFIEELTWKEVAEKLELPSDGAAKMKSKRCLNKLKELLTKQ